jgi:hypothetical protein
MKRFTKRSKKMKHTKSRKTKGTKSKYYYKYKCVKIQYKTKKRRGGAVSTSMPTVPTGISLPMVIDKNNVAYSCTPIPTSTSSSTTSTFK